MAPPDIPLCADCGTKINGQPNEKILADGTRLFQCNDCFLREKGKLKQF